MEKIRNTKSKIFKQTPGQKLQKVIEMLKVKDPKIIYLTKGIDIGIVGNLTECRIPRHPKRTLVFCNSTGCVKKLATFSFLRFQADDRGLLIATDIASRCLDISSIEHVIHYQIPRTSESYRSGRTARAQKEGITVLIMEPSEKQFYSRLCKTLNRTEDLPTFPVVDRLLVAVKERVNLAREIDKFELTCRRENSQKGWNLAKEMDLVLDDDELGNNIDVKEMADIRRSLKAKRSHPTKLFEKPLFPKNFSGKYLDNFLELTRLDQNSQKAIDVIKRAMDEYPKLKKKVMIYPEEKEYFTKKRSK